MTPGTHMEINMENASLNLWMMSPLSLETQIRVINKTDSKDVFFKYSGILTFSNAEINLRIHDEQVCKALLACTFCRTEWKRGADLEIGRKESDTETTNPRRPVYLVCRKAHIWPGLIGLLEFHSWSINYVPITQTIPVMSLYLFIEL